MSLYSRGSDGFYVLGSLSRRLVSLADSIIDPLDEILQACEVVNALGNPEPAVGAQESVNKFFAPGAQQGLSRNLQAFAMSMKAGDHWKGEIEKFGPQACVDEEHAAVFQTVLTGLENTNDVSEDTLKLAEANMPRWNKVLRKGATSRIQDFLVTYIASSSKIMSEKLPESVDEMKPRLETATRCMQLCNIIQLTTNTFLKLKGALSEYIKENNQAISELQLASFAEKFTGDALRNFMQYLEGVGGMTLKSDTVAAVVDAFGFLLVYIAEGASDWPNQDYKLVLQVMDMIGKLPGVSKQMPSSTAEISIFKAVVLQAL